MSDWLDWTMRGFAGAFGLFTLAFVFSRISAFAERDVAPFWWVGLSLLALTSAAIQIVNWLNPITTIVYLANGGEVARPARLGDRQICIPAKSYDGFSWRFGAPASVLVGGTAVEPPRDYPIGKGTWFINLSTVLVTADMYGASGGVAFDALFADRPGAYKVSSDYGRPFRLFTQAPLDRFYAAGGDVAHDSIDGPCPTR